MSIAVCGTVLIIKELMSSKLIGKFADPEGV